MIRAPLSNIKWLSPFRPQRTDPDLRPVPLGFLALILVGGLLLMSPFAHAPGQTLGWLDAMFVSTSAVCVTGLSPVNIADTLNGFGQGVVLALIQLGGLGIVTASLALVVLSGNRMSLAHEGAVAATIGRLQRTRPAALFGYSCLMVALAELAGIGALFWRLRELNPTADPLDLVWPAVFHAVSAFCNAGFSIFPEGLVRWSGDAALLGIIDLLVIAGGLGLVALVNLRFYRFWKRDRRKRGRITLQTRLVVIVSVLLIAIGAVLTLIFERHHTIAGVPWPQKISWAVFHSVMTRTAGFNVVEPYRMHPATLLCSLGLMFVGGSPGSMAGGIKTITLAVLFCTARAALLRQETVQIFGRRLHPRVSATALMVFLLAIAAVAAGIIALMLTELGKPSSTTSGHWLGLTFEAVSAFGTVGLSTGVTPLLSAGGKAVIMVLMFAGRVGLLVLAVYLARPVDRWHVRYPEEDVALS